MNLVCGKIVKNEECEYLIDNLESKIQKTMEKAKLNPMIVVEACNNLSKIINVKEHGQMLIELGFSPLFVNEYINDVKLMMSKEYLINKLKKELGDNYNEIHQYEPLGYDKSVSEKIMPLGVIFHIAAGNADGLPVFTVIEGLLTGNINILKLPSEEGGISVRILVELFRIEPLLAEYVYVFDYSSKEIEVMKKLSNMADAIVIWGNDAAISSVRAMAAPNTKIIEWGHKISFAYVSKSDVTDEELKGIAINICQTNQLLCSSCQGIFVDTDSLEEIHRFSERFLKILEETSKEFSADFNIEVESQNILNVYTESMKSIFNDTIVFKGKDCSVTAYSDSLLQTSFLFRNCWVRRLTRQEIIRNLRPYKNHLQTIGLICEEESVNDLTETFWKTGAVRITDGSHMSKMYNEGAHDGEFSLRRYTKTVVYEKSISN